MKPDLEGLLLEQMRESGLPEPERQARLFPPHRWRFDFCFREHRVLIEVMGGLFSGGGHVRGVQYELDCDKSNYAVKMGWAVFRVTGKQVEDGRALSLMHWVLGEEVGHIRAGGAVHCL